MKQFFLYASLLLLFAACTPQNYYQLVETNYDDLEIEDSFLKFENNEIKILYNFWADKGNGSFIVLNKTKQDIFIDLKRSHLIINGFAFTYFQDRNIATPKISFFSPASDDEINEKRIIKLPGVSPKNVPEQAVDIITFNEERIICIPPNSSQMIFGFDLQKKVYRNCQMLRFPKSKEIISSEFNIDNSPLKYRNRITYSFTEDFKEITQIENEFWTKKITNYPSTDFIKEEYKKYCNDSTTEVPINTYPFQSSSSFYFNYKLEPSSIKY